MGIVIEASIYKTLKVKIEGDICFIQMHRPEANNTINAALITEMTDVINICSQNIKIVVLEGLPEVFCFGADFESFEENAINQDPKFLYDLWLKLANGTFLSVAHVQGKVNAGGLGFVASCDIVLCEEKTVFSLSELLFGLLPACVLPFLIRRIGYSKSNYMTLMTQPITVKQAYEWGLVDAYAVNSNDLLRKHLLRLRLLNHESINRYKRYMNMLNNELTMAKTVALEMNTEVFSDRNNIEKIDRFVKTGQFPWE